MASNTKLDINKATKDQLVSAAGLRPAVADSIVKYREEHGRVADLEALREVSGVGAAALEQLKSTLEVVGEAQAKVAKTATEGAAQGAKAGTEATGEVAKKAADTGAAAATSATKDFKAVTDNVHEMASATARTAARAVPSAPELQQAAQTAANTAEDVGQVWVHTMNAQLEDGMATFRGLVAARDYRDVVDLQAKFVSNSVGRLADLQTSYLAAMGKLAGQLTSVQRRDGRPNA